VVTGILNKQIGSELGIGEKTFMTAHDDAATRDRIRRSGAAGYLGKPFDGQALLDAIRRVAGPAAAPR
jgi:FixJ family two-component response regulator